MTCVVNGPCVVPGGPPNPTTQTRVVNGPCVVPKTKGEKPYTDHQKLGRALRDEKSSSAAFRRPGRPAARPTESCTALVNIQIHRKLTLSGLTSGCA
jgi:hypothetical protein